MLRVAEPLTIEFDLDPVKLVELQEQKREKVGQYTFLVLLVLLGVLGLLENDTAGAFVGLALAAVLALGLRKLPQIRQATALRMAGYTKIVFSDAGMEFSGANVAERVPWSRFMRVNERPGLWVLQTKAPVASFLVPRSAVPPELVAQFTAQMMDWSGKSYKLRKR